MGGFIAGTRWLFRLERSTSKRPVIFEDAGFRAVARSGLRLPNVRWVSRSWPSERNCILLSDHCKRGWH